MGLVREMASSHVTYSQIYVFLKEFHLHLMALPKFNQGMTDAEQRSCLLEILGVEIQM